MRKTIYGMKHRLQEIFDYLHQHPEISWDEYETTAYIKSIVSAYDCNVTTFADIPGIIVEVGKGKPVIGLQADIDALWQEVDGIFQANHSCGHDAHMTIVLGAFLTMMEEGLPESGTFRFIFQPAEEKGKGALKFVNKGVTDDLDYLYGLHLRPQQELKEGYFSPAIKHGASNTIHGKITGEDAHAARPHLNANAIQIGSDFFQHLNSINLKPLIPYSAKMTSFHAGGESANVIPGSAEFLIDMRAQTNDAMEDLTNKIEEIAKMLAGYYEVSIELETKSHIAAAVLSDDATNIMKKAIKSSVGSDKLAPIIQTSGGDDFHFYKIKNPHIKATMLGIGCNLLPGLHHPEMTFNKEVIPTAVEVAVRALLTTVQKENHNRVDFNQTNKITKIKNEVK